MITFQDAREGMALIPANSVDMIFTDPPYIAECISLYGDLAMEAKRVLKPGGYVFAYCGAQFLSQIIELMNPHLEWFWLFEIMHRGGYPRMWNKKIMVGCKPVVAYTKGKPSRTSWLTNLIIEKGKSKEYHKWGQPPDFPRKIITSLTDEGDTILDPFVGGGTTAKVCKELNRKFIGFEIDSSLKPIIDSRMAQECLAPFILSEKDNKKAIV
jgi:DNA modification methylase